MALGKKETARSKFDAWLSSHNVLACVLVGLSVAAALIGLFLFVAFSGFGASADFIYNQF